MAIFSRDQNQVAMQFESGTYAVPSGVAHWIGLVTNHDLTESENVIELRHTGTASRNYGHLIGGPVDYEGTITFHPQDFRMFAFALGSMVTVSGTTNSHKLSELDGDGAYAYTSGTLQLTNFPSFTIVDSKKGAVADGQQAIRTIKGCVVDSFVLSANNGEVVQCELKYKGQSFTLGSKTADVLGVSGIDSTRPFVWSDSVLTIGGTAMNEVNSLTYTLENTVENRHFVNGSRVAQAMVPTMRNHILELNLATNSTWFKTLSDYHKNGSIFNAALTLTQSASEIGIFTFSGCEITELGTTSESEGVDETTITVRPQSVSFIGSDVVRLYAPY